MLDDLINRQAAIDAVEFGITYAKAINKSTGEVKELFKEGNKALNEAVERLKELPSAQPEPCEDTISRQAAIDAIIAKLDAIDHVPQWVFDELTGAIGDLPSAQPEPCGDVVSRNAIVQKLNEMDRYVSTELRLCDTDKKFPQNEVFIVDDVYEEIVEQLPSAQPVAKDINVPVKDCISRQAVIEINRSYHGQMPNEVNYRIWKEINELPSVQPEHTNSCYTNSWCIDCKEYDTENKCCPRYSRIIKQTLDDAYRHGETEAEGGSE